MTMIEDTLFAVPVETHLPVRSSDPATSRLAAKDLASRVKVRKREVLNAMRALDCPAPASVIRQQMRRQGVIRELGTVRSRLAQLRHDGLVVNTGGVAVVAVEDGGSGKQEQVWALAGVGQ